MLENGPTLSSQIQALEVGVCLLASRLNGAGEDEASVLKPGQLADRIAQGLNEHSDTLRSIYPGAEAVGDVAMRQARVLLAETEPAGQEEASSSARSPQEVRSLCARRWMRSVLDYDGGAGLIPLVGEWDVLLALSAPHEDLVITEPSELATEAERYAELVHESGGAMVDVPAEISPEPAGESNEEQPPDMATLAERLVDYLGDRHQDGGDTLAHLREFVADQLYLTGLDRDNVQRALDGVLDYIYETVRNHANGYHAFGDAHRGYRRLNNPYVARAALRQARKSQQEA